LAAQLRLSLQPHWGNLQHCPVPRSGEGRSRKERRGKKAGQREEVEERKRGKRRPPVSPDPVQPLIVKTIDFK